VRPVPLVEGRVAVLDRPDVDTDQIMPKQFLKRIERTGWDEFLFYDWRKEPGFELNRPEYRGARILLAGRNFGCGSSREHAPWALQEYGFDAIVAPSFADIFASNCLKIGLVTITLPEEQVRKLMEQAREGGAMVVDVERLELTAPTGETFPFELDEAKRHKLVEGLDDIGESLLHEDEIAAFESRRDQTVDTLALA
jgi:3-isopropylmalate/(R)-2-methylmalate dehydratase small subunit